MFFTNKCYFNIEKIVFKFSFCLQFLFGVSLVAHHLNSFLLVFQLPKLHNGIMGELYQFVWQQLYRDYPVELQLSWGVVSLGSGAISDMEK